MAANQQSFSVNFSGDIDTKTDPFQVAPTDFAAFNNSIRTVGGRVTKRNGYQLLAQFSSPFVTNLAVFNGALVGIGSSLQVLTTDTDTFYNRGPFQPIGLSTLPAIRNSATQTSVDVAIAPNGLALIVCGDSQAGIIYQIIDSATGAVIRPLGSPTTGASVGHAFVLGNNFIVTYCVSNSLHYVAIPYANPLASATDTTLVSLNSPLYDGVVSPAGVLYLCYNSTASSGDSYQIASLSSSLAFTTGATETTTTAPLLINTCFDSTNNVTWATVFTYNSSGTITLITTAAFSTALTATLAPTTVYTTNVYAYAAVTAITSVASGGVTIFVSNADLQATTYAYVVNKFFVTIGGTVTSTFGIVFALVPVGRPFINTTNSTIYWLAFYQDQYQPTYFLVDSNGVVVAKLAYSNGGAPNFAVNSSANANNQGTLCTAQYGYLYQDLIAAVNKTTGSNPSGIYTQAGANICEFTLNEPNVVSTEIGGSLQASGGFLWMFDGESPVENGFHVWPDPVGGTKGTGGALDSANEPYYYQVTYEWTDGSGNIHRSAPSVPFEVTGLSSGAVNSVTLLIPTLGFTLKQQPNPVRIVVYRWATAGPAAGVYYQVSSQNDTSGSNPLTLNAPSSLSVMFTDVLGDSAVVGNNILYTSGGVVEDIGGPASNIISLFDTRLWLVDAEDPNLLWFSKQVIEGTPVEMSDLLTFYVAPTTSSQTSTGPITGLGSMDDKLIIFKGDAIYYINGTGPDNTGSNNNYSQPIFITSSVGCSNQKSIVLTPEGTMFQSGQGIWLLGRDLSTTYIGAPMEAYNNLAVTSAVSITNTTQIRFTLANSTELIYDYFYKKWTTASIIGAPISGVIFQGLHTYLDSVGNVWREFPNSYVDGTNPVNQSLTTPWYNLAGLEGYLRAYFFSLLGTYQSPHTLTIQISYDYETSPSQTIVWNPNYTNPNGDTVGGSLEMEKFFFDRQKCMAVKFSITEAFDSTFGGVAGQGLTLSGINFTLGILKSFRPTISAEKSAG